SLRALEHNASAVGNDVVEHAARVCDEGTNLFGCGRVFVVHLCGIERIGAEERVGDCVLFCAGGFNVGFKQRRLEQVDNAQTAASHLVFVGRANATAGGANFVASGRAFGGQLDHAVIGQDDLGAIGDEQLL